ncbi:tigger transposable element-derived protein 1-like [Hemicordylus capensis]|uniref:tigger transposable element-derived protein 1-like n=1 Tax=Hemicordylus capensis TaxID=884348 RepID=UPI0023025722|nr:tigger transposable element-derived protein 1-like [Hemicordylus capensis]
MAPKKPAESGKRKRELILLEVKQDIIRKHEQGMRVVDLAREYGRSASTIVTILKDKERIMGRETAKGVTILTKNRPAIMDEVEKLLLLWIHEKERAGDTVTSAVVCAKARALHADLIAQQPGTSHEEFKASHGWFEKFKMTSGIRSVVWHGEAASSDLAAAEEFATEFLETVTAKGYLPEQVFNCDETGLFWKRMPRRTFITQEETKMPGHKPMKDCLTLLFCANARGDLKVKPLLVYHSENPRAFKKHKVNKERLSVMWRSNAKAWVTRVLFVDWVNQVFGPTVRRYLQEKNLPLKAILLMDNAPAHPPGLEEDLAEEFKFIRVIFLPPNTTPLIQPMDQQLIANFKKLYMRELFRRCLDMMDGSGIILADYWKHHFDIVSCLQLIKIAWDSVSQRNLNSCWKNLWAACVASTESSTQEQAVVEEIVSLGQTMGLEVSTQDVEELAEGHNLELSTEDLLSLQEQEQQGVQPDTPEEQEEEPRQLPSSSYKRACELWGELQTFVNDLSEDQAAAQEAVEHFDNVVVAPWRAMLRKRQRQQTMHWCLARHILYPEDFGIFPE